MAFPKDFMWGAASASFQVEGAASEDGKGPSIWDELSRFPGRVVHGETGDIAADQYHHMKEDVALMKEIGLKTYRFSISWPRVMPEGTGRVNEKGLQYYSDLVDELLAAGIRPMVTLYHWDLPMAIHERGGWKNREIVEWFAEYTKAVVDCLSDRVEYWFTLNEPQCFIGLGYLVGMHAPFEQNPPETLIRMSHHALMAHGAAVQVIRRYAKISPKIGMAPTGDVVLPGEATGLSERDARRSTFSFSARDFAFGNSWWADPVFLGDYPREAYEAYPEAMEYIQKEDLELISQPLDFYGFNVYYGRPLVRNSATYDTYMYQGSPRTGTDWPLTPEVLYWAPKFFHERYHVPVMITENGMSGMDWISLDGRVHDMQRIDYMHRYLLCLEKAIDEGIPVLGYTAWSVIDNMEWNSGYDKRFGIIYVDYRTQERTIKDSGYWYGKVIATNGESLSD